MFWNNVNNVTNTIWAVLESLVIIGTPVFWLNRIVKKMDNRLYRIEYQLYENGGGSMKDQMNNQDKALHELQINQAVIKAKLDI